MLTHLQRVDTVCGTSLHTQYRYMSTISRSVQVCWAMEHRAPVVIKRIRRGSQTFASRLVDELMANAHENILTLLKVHHVGSDVLLVSEWLRSGDLADVIPPMVGMPESECVYFARQIASGLAHLHGLGYCHRDLKPENIGFYREHEYAPYVVKLLDLDSAAPLREAVADKFCGTIPYMAPELFDDGVRPHDLHLDKCDVWALGTIIYTMLCGRFPWTKATADQPDFVRYTSAKQGISARECIQRARSGAPARLSPVMETLLENTLRLRPSERWSARRVCDYFDQHWPQDYAAPLAPRAVALYTTTTSSSSGSAQTSGSSSVPLEACHQAQVTAAAASENSLVQRPGGTRGA